MVTPYSHPREPATTHEWIKQWFTDYHLLIVRYVERIVGCPDQAADILQETFLRAFKALNPAHVPNDPQGWLCRIATNLAIDHLRHRRRWAWLLTQWHPASNPDMETATTQIVHQCILRLKPADAEVLLLTQYLGYSTNEVAALNGEESGTVRKRLSRARERFRVLYEKEMSL